jgi:stage II sporulation protein GA (sporulation sigma-E factor processing peptidase)
MLQTVYIEYVLIDNFIMNFLILRLSARICSIHTRLWRAAVTSLICAGYAAAAFSPGCSFLAALPVRICMTLSVAAMAYPWRGIRAYARSAAAVIFTTFLVGGTALGLAYAFRGDIQNGTIVFNGFSFRILCASAAFADLLAEKIRGIIRSSVDLAKKQCRTMIKLGGKEAVFVSLIDTGNSLHEARTDLPVIIAKYENIRPILPGWAKKEMFDGRYRFSNRLWMECMDKGFCLLPFRSLGKEGFMLGFKPDAVEIWQGDQRHKVDAIIAVTLHSFGQGIEALMNPELMS